MPQLADADVEPSSTKTKTYSDSSASTSEQSSSAQLAAKRKRNRRKKGKGKSSNATTVNGANSEEAPPTPNGHDLSEKRGSLSKAARDPRDEPRKKKRAKQPLGGGDKTRSPTPMVDHDGLSRPSEREEIPPPSRMPTRLDSERTNQTPGQVSELDGDAEKMTSKRTSV